MKRVFVSIICVLLTISAFSQGKDAIVGKWLSQHGNGQIQIFKKGDKYFGKLIWLKEPNDDKGNPKHDVYNPDTKLRSRPVLGLEILKDFAFEDGTYEDGTVYDPKSGKTYSCKMTIKDNKLNIRGYIGISLLGRTEIWSRVQS
ncbi:DUF2147 domain-containing protein [Pedobacter sp. HMF7647]|uniref:DUF2147 domain-containing protein n=1 Tax=Hufsiella arboris TaxID=2695275 RepID=A0A7K1YD98_9SPHI|nr:DUF2147 domain-containing protein [Hufsiella arboris]MXV52566.1 DUF2147 domain-containing protein [Hufsiella arboris]